MVGRAAASPKQPLVGTDAEQTNTEGWPTFWAVVLSCSLAVVVSSLVIPDMATSYFNRGVDPCVGKNHSSPDCIKAIEKAGAANAATLGVKAFLSFMFSPLVGTLCDTLGRKPLILGGAAIVALIPLSLLGVQVAGRSLRDVAVVVVLSGVVPLQIPSNLWIADRTRPEERLAILARLHAALDLEHIAGPILSAVCSRLQCIIFATVCGALAPFLALVSLRESRSIARMRSNDPGDRASHFCGFGVIFSDRELSTLTLLCFIGVASMSGSAPIILLYFKARFGLTRESASPILAAFGFSSLCVMMFLVRPLGRMLGFRALIGLSFASGIIFLTVLILAPDTHWLVLGVPFVGLSASCHPAISALYLSIVPDHVRGRAQGALTSVVMLASFVGPIIYGGLFSLFSEPRLGLREPFLGAPWLAMILGDLVCVSLLYTLPPEVFTAVAQEDEEEA